MNDSQLTKLDLSFSFFSSRMFNILLMCIGDYI